MLLFFDLVFLGRVILYWFWFFLVLFTCLCVRTYDIPWLFVCCFVLVMFVPFRFHIPRVFVCLPRLGRREQEVWNDYEFGFV